MTSPRLGTPISDTAVRVMLLGAGELGKEVAIELQRLGAEVIAVDRYPNAPAMQVAHRSHVIPMTDAQVLNGVILAEAPHIEAAGMARVIPTARAVQLTMNREGIRRLAAEELGLPTSPYAFAGSEQELAEGAASVGFPCFVKPVMSSSGKGQSYVEGPDQIADAWAYAQSGGRVEAARVIVEGRIDFDYEITLLTVRSLRNGEVVTDFCDPIGHRQEKGDYVESWQPQAMTDAALTEAQRIARAVTDDLGGLGVFGVELFVKGDQVWFSEVSPRPHDTGLVTLASQIQSEFALHARAILGLPVDVTRRAIGASAVIYGGIEAHGVAYEGVADALSVATADLRLFGKPEAFRHRRMGVATATGDDTGQARERAREAAGKVRVVSR